MARKARPRSLLQRLEEARSICHRLCECDGKGCALCEAGDTIDEAIQKIRDKGLEPYLEGAA